MNPWNIPSVTPDELPDGALIIDVREAHEWDAGHIDGARHIPMGDIPATVADEASRPDPDEPVYVVCAVGARSAQVAAWLVRQGYDAVNISGGMHAWADSGRPMISSDGSAPTVL